MCIRDRSGSETKPLMILPQRGSVELVNYCTDESRILTAGANSHGRGVLNLWSSTNAQLIGSMFLGKNRIRAASFSPDGTSVLIVADGVVQIFESDALDQPK